ncbi:HAD-IA family hydrolase [Pseudooceanicola aestuarii]|uniref:HAD-IA family hydrolase n=1 Tax=Pseudooceanicola aestuarii TaxID=2697319 RepID=UPI0013D3AB7B|nr:HAD-IA family hydrolase [Pseudooceanicola aestuarii]
MMPRLVVFDVDGTLVDSQADIVASMTAAFLGVALPVPERAAVLRMVGLSLDHGVRQIAPGLADGVYDRLVSGYKAEYQRLRLLGGAGGTPLYPGMMELLDGLCGRDDLLLGIATGKSRRGLLALLEMHGLDRHFVTLQMADDHPGKPHPSMLLSAMAETGVTAAKTVMIGDTTYDRDMAQAAGAGFIGVGWGYHAPEEISPQRPAVTDAAALRRAIDDVFEVKT